MGFLEPDGRHRRRNGQASLSRINARAGNSPGFLYLGRIGMTGFRTLDDMGDIRGKRVLVREDLNVPMDGARVTDDTRLRAAAPTILELADRGAIVLILAHFGRPKGERRPDMSLALVTQSLASVLGREVRFVDDCVNEAAETAVAEMQPGEIALLENTRFHSGEEVNRPRLVEGMAKLGDMYVNDAFSAAH